MFLLPARPDRFTHVNNKVLITGARGQLGQALLRARPSSWTVSAFGSDQLDISDADAVGRAVQRIRPTLILNAAAYNAVDHAETDTSRAIAVNAEGPLNLVRAANQVGARLMHVSTDYVFDGTARQPYGELAEPNPVNLYGRSKLLGEQQVLAEQPHALVVRTAWVYSDAPNNFVATVLKAARGAKPLRVVDDQTGAPTFAANLAQAIVELAAHGDAAAGIYHYTGATALTRYEFAKAILEVAVSIDEEDRPENAKAMSAYRAALASLQAISSNEYPSAAIRPNYTVLDCRKIMRLGIAVKPLMHDLPHVVRQLMQSRR